MSGDGEEARTKRLLAQIASPNLILDELVRRGSVIPCSASFLFDGRAVREQKKIARQNAITNGLNISDDDLNRQFEYFCEVKALEIMSRGFAAASREDKVHMFEITEAKGDFAPGSVHCTVRMLAIPILAEDGE